MCAEKFHTCGGPRRRPGLGEGRGRRILYIPPMWPSHVGSKELLKKQSLPAKTAGQFVFSFDV